MQRFQKNCFCYSAKLSYKTSLELLQNNTESYYKIGQLYYYTKLITKQGIALATANSSVSLYRSRTFHLYWATSNFAFFSAYIPCIIFLYFPYNNFKVIVHFIKPFSVFISISIPSGQQA